MLDIKIGDSPEVDLQKYTVADQTHAYVEDLSGLDADDAAAFLNVGIETDMTARAGTFIQKDNRIIHCNATQNGVDIMGISQAIKTVDGLSDHVWKLIDPEKDDFTRCTYDMPTEGFFIRSRKGVKVPQPVQTCLHIAMEKSSQHVHNIVIAEEGSDMHIISGCSTSPHLIEGLHVGISEFYVKKGAKLTYTMIHDWGKAVNVRPRTVTHVEAGGIFISNYVSLKPVGSLQTNPLTILAGKGAVARLNSVLVAAEGSQMDVGSEVVLEGENSRAEIISRAITAGGSIIARGKLIGKTPGIKAHLECKGLILSEGFLHAIPELEGFQPGVEMSHEAAVGKIDQREIEYLMARGMDEDAAISTIVRGFLNVEIDGLPASLVEKLDKAIAETQNDVM
ncbi:MAG: hypothetical protein CSA22_01940 [Deltaproteobacteria bacterium]|nr:MAG: hypothetical protein CSA22_01940 [Deltaproteobacteria bacterium]